MPKLAILILTYNEEVNIVPCIESAAFADEVVVVDSGSGDRTVELARQLGAKVVTRKFDGFGPQRNFALTQTDADWVMFLDADERITSALAAEMRSAADSGELAAYEILRHNYAFGQRIMHGGFRPDYSLRFYPRSAISWDGVVHEQATVTVPKRKMRGVMLHHTYTDWDRYFVKFNSYTTLMARKMHEQGRRGTMIHIMFRPWWAFLKFYIFQSGWRDGRLGFILSAFHFFYTMAKYVKLYYLQAEEKNQ
ncbi:glycosyltransferase family 2 protein [Anaeroselena agilis]|uniref:Glycosyltransferase family 2 protein n=1 Tax=Anaeroselena agilis TaxID=3063788 RepID=A0ABU3P480_9FIRM|nr:glycosyltransferase family 2 protein [Selenomonadales bacterium 4137-cl]